MNSEERRAPKRENVIRTYSVGTSVIDGDPLSERFDLSDPQCFTFANREVEALLAEVLSVGE